MSGNKYSKYTFRENLKKRRIERKFSSHEKLAEKMYPNADSLDSMRKKVARWENGLAEPTVSEFYQLCEVLDCDPEYLWGTIDEPRRDTRTVMEITRLNREAVETLAQFTHSFEGNLGLFDPAIILSTILSNPSFYCVLGDMYSSIINHANLELLKIRRSSIKPEFREEYELELHGMGKDIEKMGELVNFYGYSIVNTDELKSVIEFRINQNIGSVIHETLTLLHDTVTGALSDSSKGNLEIYHKT